MPEHNEKMFETIARLLLKYHTEEENLVILSEDIEQRVAKLAFIIKERFDRPILPMPGESIAVPIQAPKTAALFFDKVWHPASSIDPPPKGISIYGATEHEIWLEALYLGTQGKVDDILAKLIIKTQIPEHLLSQPIDRFIAEALFEHHGIIATPVYESIQAFRKEYHPGNTEVIFLAIKDLEIVDENKLGWPQVEEFRKDSNARRKYRRMVHWLDFEMVGKPVNFISDRIANKLEDYEWALKKHGIETITGCLSRIIDPRFIGASSAALVGLTLAGDQFLAAIGGLSLLGGKTAISITKTALDIIDRRRGKDSEVAFVYNMKKKLK